MDRELEEVLNAGLRARALVKHILRGIDKCIDFVSVLGHTSSLTDRDPLSIHVLSCGSMASINPYCETIRIGLLTRGCGRSSVAFICDSE